MWNWTRWSGVYSNMHRAPLFLVCSLAALAQQSTQQDPLDTAIQAVWQARSNGRFEDAAAAREQARAQLQRAPADSPRFTDWVYQVMQLYQHSNLNVQARVVLQESLTRTGPLGDSHPSQIAILSALGDSWRQDGNLLKAVGYLEKTAAAQTAAPPAAGAQRATRGVIFLGNRTSYDGYASGGYFGSGILAYTQLADLYQKLGRPDAVAAVAVKMRALASNDETALARFYEQRGQFEEAAAIYKKLAEQTADPYAKANGWQSLANLYAGQEHYTDAIAAIQQAIAAVQSSDNPGIRSQSLYQNLACYMGQAGLLDQGDQVYQQLLQQNRDGPREAQVLDMYAQYLADTKRGAQGENLLKDYLAGSSSPDPQQKASVLFQLANLARRTGDSQSADEYQQAGQALQPQPPAPSLGQSRIGEELREAQTAVSQHRLDDAYALAMRALDAAVQAADGQQVEWLVPQVAHALAANKESAKAGQLFQRLFALAQNWSVDSMQPLIAVAQSYTRFLMSQPDRWSEVPAAIEQYRSVLIDANGSDSGSLAEPLQMRIEFERSQMQWEKADALARELLELQESLSGNTSDPYLRDLQTAARVYEAAGDSARALPLLRKAITVADLLATPNNDWRRSETRMDTALALARQGQFDEAEALGEEAVALQRPTRTPRPPLAQQLERIRWMKQAAANASASRVDQ
jgi:tetratricopeptide (TPR) repeat protein